MHFCTLFDSNYLSRGLALYHSLEEHCDDFHLYVFPFDNQCYQIMKMLDLANVTVVSLGEFEDDDLLKVKPGRTKAEYCWTATSSIIFYVLKQYNVKRCTYIDADLFFYSSPKVLIDEMKNESVLITEHRYTKEYDLSRLSGIYCVQFITFTNDELGLTVLRWWRNACLEWCYAREEEGKFGDQKYLDDWTTRFPRVHVLRHLGGGVAPWNVQQYILKRVGRKITIEESRTGKEFELVFYHFHYVRFYGNRRIDLGDYRLNDDVVEVLYKPYLRELEAAKQRIQAISRSFDPHGPREKERGVKASYIILKRRIRRTYNLYTLNSLLQ